MSREITQDEMQRMFLEYIADTAVYWSKLKGKADLEKLNGLVFSILSMLDGCSMDLPAFEIIPSPHPDDKEYHKKVGSDWWPEPPKGIDEAVTVHGDLSLHELWHKIERKDR